jgi:hypothetical protein
MKFYWLQDVRVKETAFGDSEDWQDLLIRGSVGKLLWREGEPDSDPLWEWESQDYPWLRALVLESELEVVTA